MGAEQKISASAFTHRGEEFTSNTGNYLLDGRQPFDFELLRFESGAQLQGRQRALKPLQSHFELLEEAFFQI